MDEEAVTTQVDLTVGWIGAGGALLGAIIGGLITFAVAYMSQRGLDKQAEKARERYVLDRRYDAHLEYLRRVNALVEQALHLWTALYHDHALEKKEQTHRNYIDAWDRFNESATGPQLTGPATLATSAVELRRAIVDYANALDAWFAEGSHENIKQSKDTECNRLRDVVGNKREAYVVAAQVEFAS